MKKFLFLLFLTVATVTIAQEKGTLKGLVTDKEANNEPLPFANILIKGTTNGEQNLTRIKMVNMT
ncbi:carboxypeptidase-like regulatory domain-containing protein [Polaribacter sp.]|nr:carboxypeptidase-like regulatory domain-containing protein [Polaribacter sp.]